MGGVVSRRLPRSRILCQEESEPQGAPTEVMGSIFLLVPSIPSAEALFKDESEP